MLASLSPPAAALESAFVSTDYLQARLVSGVTATGSAEQVPAGLELRLADGWHAYWRMPGDGGLPPELDWDNSENIKRVEVLWPQPQRFETFGLHSFGYTGSVLLPLAVVPKVAGQPVRLNLQAAIMVCEEICVPQKVNVVLEVPAGQAMPSQLMPLIERARAAVPHRGDLPALKIENVVAGPKAIVVTAFSQAGFEGADLFVETGDLYVTAPPEITPDNDDPRHAMLRVPAPEGIENFSQYIMSQDLTVTLVAGRRAVEKTIPFAN